MISVERFSKEEWLGLSEQAHLIVFGEKKTPDMERLDFALLMSLAGKLLGYCTCREYDHETLYIQYGGTFPETIGTVQSWKVYAAGHDWVKERYKRVITIIENTNVVMLKMAMKIGYRIVGLRSIAGKIFLEHCLEFAHAST